MAQKETSSKSRRWLGLSGAAVLVANLVLTGTTIAFQQEGEVNHALEGEHALRAGMQRFGDVAEHFLSREAQDRGHVLHEHQQDVVQRGLGGTTSC